MPEQLEPVEFPEGCEFVWAAFCELNDTRQSGMGIGAITFTEIKAFQDLRGIRFRQWELDSLRALDRLSRSIVHGN